MKKVLAKINLIQNEVGAISKNAENPFHKSNYADLANIQDSLQAYLEANKLMVYHNIVDSKLITTVYDIESGESLSSTIEISMTDPQKKGSEITYFRRYNLVCLFDLKVADDDGNGTIKKDNTSSKSAEKPKVDTWMNEKQFNAIKAKPVVEIQKYLIHYDGRTTQNDGHIYGMKKVYRTELEKLTK